MADPLLPNGGPPSVLPGGRPKLLPQSQGNAGAGDSMAQAVRQQLLRMMRGAVKTVAAEQLERVPAAVPAPGAPAPVGGARDRWLW